MQMDRFDIVLDEAEATRMAYTRVGTSRPVWSLGVRGQERSALPEPCWPRRAALGENLQEDNLVNGKNTQGLQLLADLDAFGQLVQGDLGCSVA